MKNINLGLLLIVLLCFGAWANSANAQESGQQVPFSFKHCVEKSRQANHQETIDSCTIALVETPDNLMIYGIRARAYAEVRKFDFALADADRIFALDPKNTDALVFKGLIHLALNKPEAALAEFDKAIVLNPNHLGALYQRASIYNQTGKRDLAIADLKKILIVQPNNPQIAAAIKQIEELQKPYVFKGKSLTAPKMFLAEVINLENDAVLKSTTAELVSGAKKTDSQAFDLLINCFSRFPDSTDCAKKLLESFFNENAQADFRDAPHGKWISANLTHILTTMIKAEPKNVNHYSLRGIYFLLTDKNYHAAVADFTKVMELDPTRNYLEQRADAYTELKNYEAAIADYSKHLTRYPKSSDAHRKRADIYALQGKFDQAIADVTKAVELNKSPSVDYKIALFHRAKIYGQQKKYEPAIADLGSIIIIDDAAEYAFIERAKAYRATNQTTLAILDEKRAETLKNRRLGGKEK